MERAGGHQLRPMDHDDVQMIVRMYVANKMVWQPGWRIPFGIFDLKILREIVYPTECLRVQACEFGIRSPVLLLLDFTVGVV